MAHDTIPWQRGSFKQMYGEAVREFRAFSDYATDTIEECNADINPLAIKVNFELADERYKKVVALVAHLSLWHAAKVAGKKFTDWRLQRQEENALIRSLDGMNSSTMNHLLSAYRPWLAKAQFVGDEDENAS